MSGDLRAQYAALMSASRSVTSRARAVLMAAAQAEEDAELLRSAMLDALEIFEESEGAAQGRPRFGAAISYERAAKQMALRLRALHSIKAPHPLPPE